MAKKASSPVEKQCGFVCEGVLEFLSFNVVENRKKQKTYININKSRAKNTLASVTVFIKKKQNKNNWSNLPRKDGHCSFQGSNILLSQLSPKRIQEQYL